MIQKLVKFFKDELKYVYVKKLEQKKLELGEEISRLEKIQDKNDIFFIRLNDLQKSHCKIEYQLKIKKEEWKIE